MKKKLIEVALPLEAINRESAREKSIRHGHPSTLHLWWARRPLAACRAVLFASLVDDPSSRPEEFPTEEDQDRERKRLFGIIEELVKWENSNNERVIEAARKEILKSTDGTPPPVLDPFCGGGSIPLEAQRLGLEAHASDLNPVAVLITKALIEIPPKFANQPPVNPESRKKLTHSAKWKGAQGLAEDVRYYGKWMRDEAEKRIGHLYPKVKLENGREATVLAWLWARTVKCPNPACQKTIPLIGQTWICKKAARPKSISILAAEGDTTVRFGIREGSHADSPTKLSGKGADFKCPFCGQVASAAHLGAEGRARRIGAQMMAVVASGQKARHYMSVDEVQSAVVAKAVPLEHPEAALPDYSKAFPTATYGALTFGDLFTRRQSVAIETFSSFVEAARMEVLKASRTAGLDNPDGYADAVATYLVLAIGKLANRMSSFSFWHAGGEKVEQPFAQQGFNMTWDFCEANPFSDGSGSWGSALRYCAQVAQQLPQRVTPAHVDQLDARNVEGKQRYCIVTDPPYYTNIGYSDLSDFFYVWIRRPASKLFPQIFSTLLTPKDQELVAAPYRHGGSQAATKHFLSGLSAFFGHVPDIAAPGYPVVVFYSFRQQDHVSNGDVSSTGWEVILEALIAAGFAIVGTWPIRTEMVSSLKKTKGALTTSIVLVCGLRAHDAPIATRRELIGRLKSELPLALKQLQASNIAAVDLAQAAIGPGMAVFSHYARVIEADGSPMRVRSALQLINQALGEIQSAQEGDYDANTQWAVAWFSDKGMNDGEFGVAETLSKAKNTSVGSLERDGIVSASKGKVRLIARQDYADSCDPVRDLHVTVWEVTQHLIRRLQNDGEQAAADLLRKVGGMGEIARDLAYRLYSICERKGWAEEARAYNAFVVAWPEVSRLAKEPEAPQSAGQMTFT